MTSLLWPGDHRAADLFTDHRVLAALVRVEYEWLGLLVRAGLAPPEATWAESCDGMTAAAEAARESLAVAAEDTGNPVVPLVEWMRGRVEGPTASWLHRGLTSQDVLDTALMLCSADVLGYVETQIERQLRSLSDLATTHRSTPMLAHTLTQPATESTFGVMAIGWAGGLVDALEGLRATRPFLRLQLGGAVGTRAALVELAAGRGHPDPAGTAEEAARSLAARLGLEPGLPWHTTRTPITRLGDAFVGCTDAWGHLARDVLQHTRGATGELGEPLAEARGGSSTMPGKQNPVLSLLLRRTALSTPALGSTLHLAAAAANDARPDGSWHAEWETLRLLARRCAAAAAQATELLAGLRVDTAAMAATLARATGADAEQRAMAALVDSIPTEHYRGSSEELVDAALERVRRTLGGGQR